MGVNKIYIFKNGLDKPFFEPFLNMTEKTGYFFINERPLKYAMVHFERSFNNVILNKGILA